MDENMNDFLVLVSRAIHSGKSGIFPENADPEKLVETAKLHKLLPLIVQSEKDNKAFSEHRVFESASAFAKASVVAQIKRTEIFKILYRKMNENGIFPIVMKGIICRNVYGTLGDYRVSGDEDILVKKEDFLSLDTLLRNEGFQPDKENLCESIMDKLQEVTYTSPDNDLRLEVHLNPIGREDSFRKKMNSYFADAFTSYREENFDGVSIRTMTHTKHFLFLVFHAFKHLTVSGFGIRMVCDILLYMEKYYGEIDFDYINSALKEVKGEGFFADIVFIGKKYLGFSLPAESKINCPEELLADILESGIYGNHTQARKTSVHMVHTAFSQRKVSGKLGKAGMLFDTVFPPKERLLDMCPELENKPWLIFDVYIKRIGRFISHNRQNGDSLAAESMEIGKKRIELLKKYKLL